MVAISVTKTTATSSAQLLSVLKPTVEDRAAYILNLQDNSICCTAWNDEYLIATILYW